jgi:hypothetical protein
VLFLLRRDAQGAERIEMPCVLVPSGRSPFAELKEAFPRMTGIDGEIHETVIEGRHNAGSRKRKNWVPVLVFNVTARSKFAKVSAEFSGFRWLSMEEAKKGRLGRNCEWLRKVRGRTEGTASQ